MKKLLALTFIVSSLLFLSSCASEDEIADELIDYYNNEWIPIHGMKRSELGTTEDEIMNLIIESEEDYEKEAITLHETDMIPLADKIIDKYESIQLKHRKVKKLNKMQIKAEKYGKDLSKSVIDNYNGDISASKHRQKENQLKRKYEEVHEYLKKLMEKYNLEYDIENKVNGFYELKRKED